MNQKNKESEALAEPRRLKTLDGYLLLAVMGEGGFGSVFLAHDTESGALCALKIFKLMALEQIEREIAVTQSFEHTALLRGLAGRALTGVLREDEHVLSQSESYLVTELATNGDLY